MARNFHSSLLNFSRCASVALLPIIHTISTSKSSCKLDDSTSKPIYRKVEISEHTTIDKRVWVTYKDGVYDITDFIQNHPGGADKISLAAGKSIEPFWRVYQQHYNSKLPLEMLETMKIGTIHSDDLLAEASEKSDESDPYNSDPSPSPLLHYHQRKPINAEPPSNLLTDSWITPIDLWFIRNHHPVPNISVESYKLDVVVPGSFTQSGQPITTSYSIQDLKTKFPSRTVVVSLQCGGNRRAEMNSVPGAPATLGSAWHGAAISTGEFTGVLLRDVLADAGADFDRAAALLDDPSAAPPRGTGGLHAQFKAVDEMEASIPLRKALDRRGDVLLAYELNGVPLPTTEGYPLRVVVPGYAGVRSVKWLSRVSLATEEAMGPWQRGLAYKGFGPNVRSVQGIDVSLIPSLQETPVTSMITYPPAGQAVSTGPITARGFAYSGGGRGIVRVDVSADNGVTWHTADLTDGSQQPLDRAWAWTFWECDLDLPNSGPVPLVCKAVDASYNSQPDTVAGIWNLRGIINNAWHRAVVNVENVSEDEEIESSAE